MRNLAILYLMAKPGPKPQPLSQTRRNRLMLNLTDSEMQSLTRAAGDRHHATEYAREVLLKHLRKKKQS